MSNALQIRREELEDAESIRRIHEQAFGAPEEAALVDRLRRQCREIISLVARRESEAIGHILFSPVIVESDGPSATGMGLAPMAVLPDEQQQGVGTRLVEAGLNAVAKAGYPFVVVLGHPAYYPRFGFRKAADFGIRCPFPDVPDEAFLVVELQPRALERIAGVIRYRDEFGNLDESDSAQ